MYWLACTANYSEFHNKTVRIILLSAWFHFSRKKEFTFLHTDWFLRIAKSNDNYGLKIPCLNLIIICVIFLLLITAINIKESRQRMWEEKPIWHSWQIEMSMDEYPLAKMNLVRRAMRIGEGGHWLCGNRQPEPQTGCIIITYMTCCHFAETWKLLMNDED